LEDFIAHGCKTFIACGSCGKINPELNNNIFIPIEAVRDEGVSYHYLPPGRVVKANSEVVEAIERVLKKHQLNYSQVKTWTTSAFYRETQKRIQNRIKEGCSVVEMEAAAFFAVSQFRNVRFGQILYASDNIELDNWSGFLPESNSLREKIFWLAVESILDIKM
jgi:purine-nucleoside phosphorylase